MLSFEDPNALIESDRFWHESSWSSFVSSLAAWGWWNAGLQLTLLYHTSKKDLQNENQEMCLRCQSSNAQRDDDETSDASVRIPRNVHLKNHRFRMNHCLRSLSGAKTRHPALHRCEMFTIGTKKQHLISHNYKSHSSSKVFVVCLLIRTQAANSRFCRVVRWLDAPPKQIRKAW